MYDTLKKSANAIQALVKAGGWVVDNGVLIAAVIVVYAFTKKD
jgi:hypothetical protein